MRVFHQFFFRWQNLLALALIGLFIGAAIAAPVLAPVSENVDETGMYKTVGRRSDKTPHPPSEEALLGTLPRQVDVYFSLIWGTRHALRFGLVVSLCTSSLGIIIGAASAYAGGAFNRLTLRITDGFLAVPVIAGVGIFRQLLFLTEADFGTAPLVYAVIDFLGSDYVLLGLIFFSWMPYARIINVGVTKLRKADYSTAARSVGASDLRIILRHLLPNAITPAVVLIARDIGAMVLLEAAFAFIGIGGRSPWGTLAAIGRDFVIGSFGNPLVTWWVHVPVTIVLVLFGVGWNLLGDGLNDLLNPWTGGNAASKD